MSTLVVAVGAALSLLVAAFVRDLGVASSQQARAQLAADAAALAAVAESAPYGSVSHEAVAGRYARLNGAELMECRCARGSTAVQVNVRVGDAAARARAVIDPEALRPMWMGFDRRGLHPELARAVARLIAAARGSVRVVSGYRPPARQAALWEDALARYGSAEAADDWVAPPGHSMHERGLAVDLGGDLSLAVRIIDRLALPLYRPLSNEPWHFELAGSRSRRGPPP